MPEIRLGDFDHGQETRSQNLACLGVVRDGAEEMVAKSGLKNDDWILICDGRTALLAFNAGDELAPNLQVRKRWEHTVSATHEQGTDKPGRAFSSSDRRRSAVETTDYHRLEETQFLAHVASALEENVAEQVIRNLIVVAPPRAMGILRAAFPSSVRKLVRQEIEKDYVRAPTHEIERRLAKYLAEC